MAQTVYLKLQIDGNDVEGESTIASMEREDTIECNAFYYGVTASREITDRIPVWTRHHEPVKILKRIDKSTPLLLKALCNNEPVTSARFMFFRPAVSGSGAEEQYFTVLLENGYITGVDMVSEDAIVGGEDVPPAMMEEVTFVFRDITWTYEIGGATHKDSVKLP